MRKTRILLASLLKPVNDTRMYEKLGKSLAKLPQTEVHVAGFSAQNLSISGKIFFHPVFNFKRLSFGRLKAQWKYYKLLIQLKPEVIISTTYELLPVTVIYRIFHSTVILYDIQENYYANIRFQPTFPKPLRWLLANLVRLTEKLCARAITHFFLAEESYAAELTFSGKNHTVLENKYQGPTDPLFQDSLQLSPEQLHLLYSGTISEVYGIWEAIELAEKLHSLNQKTHLTIIGYCPLPETYSKLQNRITDKAFITLIGGNKLVPHPEIIQAIHRADIGLLPYRPNKSTWNCRPTKLFEYAANGLPCLIPENPYWEKPVKAWNAGFSINFQEPDASQILERLTSETFYQKGTPKEVFWQQEEEKLLSFFKQKLLNL